QHATLVRDLRRYLRPIAGMPEPRERFEMALAFLLASAREHQAVARWLAEPGKHEGKAAEKIRSLASITDPYREALQPWTLQESAAAEKPEPLDEAQFSDPVPAELSPGPRTAGLDPALLEGLRRAIQCREIFS